MPQDKLLLGYELTQLYQFCELNSLTLTVHFGEYAHVYREGRLLLDCDFGSEAPQAEHFRRIYQALVEKLAQEPL